VGGRNSYLAAGTFVRTGHCRIDIKECHYRFCLWFSPLKIGDLRRRNTVVNRWEQPAVEAMGESEELRLVRPARSNARALARSFGRAGSLQRSFRLSDDFEHEAGSLAGPDEIAHLDVGPRRFVITEVANSGLIEDRSIALQVLPEDADAD
jgi:hypothetical protein